MRPTKSQGVPQAVSGAPTESSANWNLCRVTNELVDPVLPASAVADSPYRPSINPTLGKVAPWRRLFASDCGGFEGVVPLNAKEISISAGPDPNPRGSEISVPGWPAAAPAGGGLAKGCAIGLGVPAGCG